MGQHFKHIFIFALAIQVCARIALAQDDKKPSFPKMKDIISEYFKAEVTITDQYQDEIAFVTEYYDQTEARGRLDFVAEGYRQSIFYYNLTGDIIYTNETACTVEEEEISDYYYFDVFFGWLHKNPLIIGPSALLWFAQEAQPEFMMKVDVRGIKCDYFELTVDSEQDNLTYGYYFADESWTAGYDFKGARVPIRIMVNGQSTRDTAHNLVASIAQTTDFAYVSSALDPIDLHPKIGLGCYGRSTEFILPKVPEEYRFSTEVYDLLQSEKSLSSEVTFNRVWFDSNTKLARIDKFTEDSTRYDLMDFNNGVTYSVENGETCKIKALKSTTFATYNGFVGYMKSPEEGLGLSGDFYFMGHRTIRGINCRVFEKAEREVSYGSQKFHLFVTTVYFSAPYTKIIKDGEDMKEVPLAIRLTGYLTPNVVSVKKEYQILGFDDIVGPLIFSRFPIDDCFPLPNQKSYFVLSSATSLEQNRNFEANSELFVDMVTSSIMNQLNVSFIRLPFVRADYHPAGVTVTGLLLDRPSSLSQFSLLFTGVASAEVKDAPGINTREQCAYACVDQIDFTCKGIHFCRGVCYLNRRDLAEEPLPSQVKELGTCEVYARAIGTTKNTEPYLSNALETLQKTIIGIEFPINKETDIVKFPDVIVDEGLINRDVTDKTYDLIFYAMQIPASQRNRPSIDKPDATTENECYRACKQDETIDCQSFSYCPSASGLKCRISSLIVSKDMNIRFGILENEPNCNVYSLLNLDYYTAYPGKVSHLVGDVTYTKLSVEECSLRCRKTDEGKPPCRGFEYCRRDRSCTLHSKHVLDYNNQKLVDTDKPCTHYAAKYSADYYDRGTTLIDDKSNARTEITFEECAKACSEELPDCRSFNYCPDTNEYAHDSSCSLTTKVLAFGVPTTESPGCRMYTKKEVVENYGNKGKPVAVTGGYTQSNYAGLVIGTLIFGLIVGAAAFIGYSFYRSRKYNDGMSVRFMKQTES